MGVSIIQGVQSIIDFADYNAAASASQYFTSYSECYDFMLQNAYKSGNSALVQGVIDGGRAGASKIVEFQPRLTGGTQAGIDVANVTENGNIVEFTTGEASMGAVPLIEIVGGILAGLGVGILSYELNKDFWIDVSNNAFLNFPGYVPITYDNIEDMSILTLFKDGRTYVDADLIQSINNYLIQIGAFAQTEISYYVPPSSGVYKVELAPVSQSNVGAMLAQLRAVGGDNSYYTRQAMGMIAEALVGYGVPSNATLWTCALMPDRATFYVNFYRTEGDAYIQYDSSSHQIWGWPNTSIQYVSSLYGQSLIGYPEGDPAGMLGGYTNTEITSYAGTVGVGQNYGQVTSSSINATIEIPEPIPELVPLQPRTISTTPNSIPTEMPDWWQYVLEIGDIDPDTMTRIAHEFLPVSVPDASPYVNPVTTPQADVQTGRVPDTNPTPVGNSVLPLMTPIDSPFSTPNDPTPKPTSTPSIPILPTIGGQANALFTVYNPSQANLDSLGSVLWTENIIQQIVQMFTNNPMDAIISLHILYATPSTGSSKEIKLGYLGTGVSAPVVINQYINLDCGTVRVPELFGDVRDYANTDVTIYLPMIGFRQLKTEDAMASYISVNYKIDVFTGTVLANITVSRDSINQIFYTFEGNCAVNLPLTGADKSRQIASALGVIGATVTGNPVMGMAAATAVAGGSARANLQRSGNFTGNAGAMGCKKPYIIVSSDIPYDAAGYNTQYGYPANLTVMLGTCHGYTKVKEVHADSIANATEQEKRDIESQLKQGVIIH